MGAEPQTEKQSRVGKVPVPVPQGVTVTINGQDVSVKGPKGQASRKIRDEVRVVQKDGILTVVPREGAGPVGRQYQGLTRALLANMIKGVSEGYKLSLDFHGVGYRAEVKGTELNMALGLSHPVKLPLPPEVKARVEVLDVGGTKLPRLHLESYDKETLGQVASKIRSYRPPEPYKGKGIRYTGEKIREKAGKAGKAGAK